MTLVYFIVLIATVALAYLAYAFGRMVEAKRKVNPSWPFKG